MKVFSGSANKPLAEKVANALNTGLSPLEIHIFPDGEKRVRVLERVVDEDCVVIQPTNPPADANYMELFFIIDAVKRSGAKSVTVVMPYLGYQRQDHVFRSGEAVSLEVVLKTIEAAGAGRMIVVDLHSIKTEEASKVPIMHLSALSLFVSEIKKKEWDTKDSMLISPDMGGIRRVQLMSGMLGNMVFGAVEKHRDLVTGHIEASEIKELTGELTKRVLIVDDMISSGQTIAKAAELLQSRRVESVVVFATHPVFSDDAPKVLQEAAIERVFVTDTISIPKEKQFGKLEVLTVADIISKACLSLRET